MAAKDAAAAAWKFAAATWIGVVGATAAGLTVGGGSFGAPGACEEEVAAPNYA